MILDTLANWHLYPLGPAWEKAFRFLESLTAEVEDGEYPIQGKDIFARVMSYSTKSVEDAVLEAHREYVDIQTALVGAEGIEWFNIEGLEVKEPYDAMMDVIFFQRTGCANVRMDILPGTFATLFAEDVHMPQLEVINAPQHVKKVVVKIRANLLSA